VSPPENVLLYDSDCAFCRWSADKLLAWDRRNRLEPVALQDRRSDQLLAGMSYEQRMASWHLVTSEGCRYSAGAAVPPLMRLLPGGRPIAAVAATFPQTTERLYRWVSRHRDRIARLLGTKACSVDPRQRGRDVA
jgi:predicted DCC family thiol-disulfide oxidoreductase YuxK